MKLFDERLYARLRLDISGSKITGKLGDDNFEGTLNEGRIDGTAKLNGQRMIHFQGTLAKDKIEGTAQIAGQPNELKWEATRMPTRKPTPQTHKFEPTQFQHFFSDAISPVLHINAGDTVATWSVDAGGTDTRGTRRTSGGNPLTGPFYIEGAVPGDTLIVRFGRIRLNRDSAISSPMISSNALTPRYVEQRKRVEGYNSDWRLNLPGGYATLAMPTETMKDYKVPLAPMLGCVGVAPAGGMQYQSGFLGSFGGNMDYNQLREGTTVAPLPKRDLPLHK